jgi:hypothetical protein
LRCRDRDCGFYELTTSSTSAGLACQSAATAAAAADDLNFNLAASGERK